ncbi:PRC-barrel domain-containing protein [Alcaligenaceae bacterium CGII-47]|nr:PRC-barrel domain-containing protein [Alcaligenaceae bacterium CGII-47]
MKKILALSACVLPLMMAPAVYAQTTAPSTAPATTSTMPGAVTTPPASNNSSSMSAAVTHAMTGLSVKHKIMGKSVYNEKDEKIGDIEDVILASDGQATTYVVGAGGFLGMGQHSVAIPFDKITGTDDKLMLQGYSKEQLKALPEVKVEK